MMNKLKVKSVKSLGIQPVYDIQMPTEHNFVLPNGIVAHNCSYAYIGYACQYLKTKYPLEWWTAVLKNSSKTELPKFWAYCGHFVDFPDINLSGDGFEIQGDKIRAPISIMNGIGEAAYQQLITGRPYKSLEDFVTKSKKSGKAVHKGVVVKLIAAGLLDSLFENKDLDVEDKIYEYMKVKSRVEGIKKVEEVPEEYRKLREVDQFLLKKELIPVISTDLRPFVLSAKGLTAPHKKHLPWRTKGSLWIDGIQLDAFKDAMENDDTFEGRMGAELKTISYIIEESTKTYANKSKQMTKILLDTNGDFRENVVWPNYGENIAASGFKNQIVEITWKFNKKRNELTIKKIDKIKVR
jgi:DNA polymerase III alpha subunit